MFDFLVTCFVLSFISPLGFPLGYGRTWVPPGGGGVSFSSGRPVIKSRDPSKIYKGGHVVFFFLFFFGKKKNQKSQANPRGFLW